MPVQGNGLLCDGREEAWLCGMVMLTCGGFAAQGLSGQDEAAALASLAERAGIPEALRPRYEALSIIPPDTPLPMTLLRRLWGLACEADAEAAANLLESKVGAGGALRARAFGPLHAPANGGVAQEPC